MDCTRTLTTTSIFTNKSAARLLRSLNASTHIPQISSIGLHHHHHHHHNTRPFSISTPTRLTERYFPQAEAPKIRITPPAWPHPIYTYEQMRAVRVAHRAAKTWPDRIAVLFVRTLRWGLDLASGYKKGAGQMTARQYMIRNVFLESVAGVPGMVAGMMRHLKSMRTLKRDHGWMESLLEESYNERMHLLTFLKMVEPGWFMRLMVLGAQGVFFNAFFVSYMISPKTCHRFVGYLEEEAVITYTRQIEDLEAGRLPAWESTQAPQIAVQYWNMPEGHRSMLDLLLYIRADESKHREVNHTFGNLDQDADPNPYVSDYKDGEVPHPVKGLQHQKPEGWEREDVIGKS